MARKTPRPPWLQGVPSKAPKYWYLVDERRKTRTSLGPDEIIARARFAEWKADQIPGKPIGVPTLDDAIEEYYRSDAFQKDIKPGTRKLYRLYLEQLRQTDLARHAIDAIDVDVVRALQERLKETPSKCYQTLGVLQTVMTHAQVKTNPVTELNKRFKRVRCEARTEVWTPQQIDAFVAAAPPSLSLAALLLFYTAQRPADVLAMTKGRVSERDGRLFIALRQKKTEALLDVPVHRDLEPALRARRSDPSDGLMLVPSTTGLMWEMRNFCRSWDRVRVELNLPPLQRRDLRRTAVVSMAEAGCSVPMIVAVTGHSLQSAEGILKTYLPRTRGVAVAGMERWEAAPLPSLSNIIELASAKKGRGQ